MVRKAYIYAVFISKTYCITYLSLYQSKISNRKWIHLQFEEFSLFQIKDDFKFFNKSIIIIEM